MDTPLRVMIVEDMDQDAELLEAALRAQGYRPEIIRALHEGEFLAGLERAPQIILSDYSMPSFGALRVMELLRHRRNDTPLIIVTGTISEEVAVECMRYGASDYLLKDRLGRLGQAVTAALESHRMRIESRRSLRLQALMIEELNHRVRNNLATMLALVDQSRRTATSIDGFVDAFSARVRSMARVHGMLAVKAWQGVRLRDLITDLVAPFVDDNAKRLRVTGDDVDVPAYSAPVLGMVIHELGTNAAKHGALANGSGTVEIAWSVRPASEDARSPVLELSWVERGGPPPRQPPGVGFGASILRDAFAYQLGGSADLHFDAEGLAYRATLCLRSDAQYPATRALAAEPPASASQPR